MYVSSEWSAVYHTRIYQTCIVILPSVLCPPEGNRETRWVSQSDEIIIYNNNNKDNLQEVFSWSSIVYWVWFTTVQFDLIISINCKIFKCCFLRFLYSHNKTELLCTAGLFGSFESLHMCEVLQNLPKLKTPENTVRSAVKGIFVLPHVCSKC